MKRSDKKDTRDDIMARIEGGIRRRSDERTAAALGEDIRTLGLGCLRRFTTHKDSETRLHSTLAHLAATYDRADVLELLYGFDKNLLTDRDFQKDAPIHSAAKQGAVSVMRFIVSQDASQLDSLDESKSKRTVYDIAIDYAQPRVMAYLLEMQLNKNVKALFDTAVARREVMVERQDGVRGMDELIGLLLLKMAKDGLWDGSQVPPALEGHPTVDFLCKQGGIAQVQGEDITLAQVLALNVPFFPARELGGMVDRSLVLGEAAGSAQAVEREEASDAPSLALSGADVSGRPSSNRAPHITSSGQVLY